MKENGIEVDLEERENWGKPKRSRSLFFCVNGMYCMHVCIVLYCMYVLYCMREDSISIKNKE